MERAGKVDPGLPLVTMADDIPLLGGIGRGLCPALTAIASAVAMVIALGLELGMHYDYRLTDFKTAADGSAFLMNGSTCVHYASKADLTANYAGDAWKVDGTKSSCKTEKNRGENSDFSHLIAASVHVLYKAAAAGGAIDGTKLTYFAARDASGVVPGITTTDAQTVVFDDTAIAALEAVAAAQPETGNTCEDLYDPVSSQADCLAVVLTEANAAVDAVKLAAGVAAAKAAAAAANEPPAVIASIVDQATADTTGLTPTAGADYTADYTGAADAITSSDGGDGQAAFEAHNNNYCPSMITSTPAVQKPSGVAQFECSDAPTTAFATTDQATQVTNRVGAVIADDAVTKYNLYLQCKFVYGLASAAPRAGPFAVLNAFSTELSRGGTLGIPQLKYTGDDIDFLKPQIPLPPFLEGVNNTLAPTTRGQILYGSRLGWSLFALIPSVILIVYLGADSVMAALCYLSRECAYSEGKFMDAGEGSRSRDIVQALVTIQTLRWMRLAVASTGLLIVFLLRVIYDWVPWNFGMLLPRAGICPSQGNGWESEEGVATTHLIILILCITVTVAQPIAMNYGSGIFDTKADEGVVANQEQIFWTEPSVGRVTTWFLLVSVAGLVLIGLESVNAVGWGVAWGNRVLAWTGALENGLTAASAVELIESSSTGAILAAVSLGVLLASIYARYLFISRGSLNKVCSLVWIGVVIAGLLPLIITFGTEFQLDPDQQAVSEDCSFFGTTDSFEKFICENRQFTYTIAILVMLAILLFMWISWVLWTLCGICTTFNAAPRAPVGSAGVPQPKVASAAAPFKSVADDRIPLLSLRVRK